MQTYNIIIDEDQRLHILEALKLAGLAGQKIDPSKDSIVFLIEMLRDLPQNEASEPGCLHGFCL